MLLVHIRLMIFFFFFFFQAEDGIRDLTVTGVQTCALPISRHTVALHIGGEAHQGIPQRERSARGVRSEEHTSELQSQSNLVCRLLLEKKKTTSSPGAPPLNMIPPPRCICATTTRLRSHHPS